MNGATKISRIGGADTPEPPAVAALDGDPADMFPLLTAAEVAAKLGCSRDLVLDWWHAGTVPHVVLPPSRKGSTENEVRRWRMRSDHLRQAVEVWAAA